MEELTLFAKRLKETREQRGMKQKELAEKINVTPQTVSAYEKADIEGKGKNPTLENAISAAKVLGVSLDWLCGLDGPDENDGFKNYKEMGKAIVSLVDTVDIGFDVAYKVGDEEYSYSMVMQDSELQKYAIEVPKLVVEDECLRKFVIEWEKIRDLWHGRTIDNKLYNLWLNDRFSSMEKEKIPELPF